MTAEWSAWKPILCKGLTGYIDWWVDNEQVTSENLANPLDYLSLSKASIFDIGPFPENQSSASSTEESEQPRSQNKNLNRRIAETLDRKNGGFIPVPTFAEPLKFADPKKDWTDNLIGMKDVPDDTIIFGIIDTGIGLANTRFRDSEGKTRVLSSWQQVAPLEDRTKPSLLPFGEELLEADINRLLLDHSSGQSLLGDIDETGFNLAAKLVDYENELGHRELSGRYAHGCHVLDLAAGLDPIQDKELADRVKIIAVNLPSRATFGASGEFLDYYIIYGFQRIIDVAQRLWNNKPNRPEDQNGFPIVTNISFGRQAGARNANDLYHLYLDKLYESQAEQTEPGLSLPDIVMPAGNDNLKQANARLTLKPGETREIKWQILPDDQTPNFVEIWADPQEDITPSKATIPLSVGLCPPGMSAKKHGCSPVQGVLNHQLDLTSHPNQGACHRGLQARIYCLDSNPVDKKTRYNFLLCVAQTNRDDYTNIPKRCGRIEDLKRDIAPSGSWTITLRNDSKETPLNIVLNIQTDQSILPTGIEGLRSYFEDEDYIRFGEHGEVADTFDESFGNQFTKAHSHDEASHIMRRGSMNSHVASPQVIPIAGFQASDGRPARYSASGLTANDQTSNTQPFVALPTDRDFFTPGTLGAGATNGSVVAMRGTSFGSARAARILLKELAKRNPGTPTNDWARTTLKMAVELEWPTPNRTEKNGHGRILPDNFHSNHTIEIPKKQKKPNCCIWLRNLIFRRS